MTPSKVSSDKRTRTSKGADVGLGRALKMPLDAYAMNEVRAGLDKFAAGRDVVPLTRENLVTAIRVMSEAIKSVNQRVIDTTSTGQFVVVNHPVIEMIDQGIDALADLDRGKTHSALKAASHQPNRALTTAQRKRDETLLATVVIVRNKYGFRTFRQAATFLAGRMRQRGHMRNGNRYTAMTFVQLRDYYVKLNKSRY